MAVGRIFGNHRAGAGSGGAGGSDRPAQSATGLPTVPAGAGGRRLYRKQLDRLLPPESAALSDEGGLPCTVLLPLEPEAREICRQYCRDRNIDTLDLPQAEKWCMIKEND